MELKRASARLCCVLLSALALAACQSGYQTRQQAANKPAASSQQAKQGSAKAPVSGKSYTVQPGDTVFGIAFRAGLNYRDLAAWNGIEEPYTIRVGQKLRLSAPVPAGTQSRPLPRKVTPAPVRSNPAATASAAPATASVQPVLSNIGWQWPTEGELVGRFVVNDKTRQGINIAGRQGQPIHAAADGTVVYSGAGLIGYGELIIVKHNNEWISAYAHNAKRLVAEGAKVKAGQHIADMGDTGSVDVMLHFEIRRNGKPVDPLLYLPAR